MTKFVGSPLVRIIVRKIDGQWVAKAIDAKGNLRSRVMAPSRDDVFRKINEYWPDVPVEDLVSINLRPKRKQKRSVISLKR